MERKPKYETVMNQDQLPSTPKIPGGGQWQPQINRRAAQLTLGLYTCVGCGEKATAKDSHVCQTDNSFIHIRCQRVGKILKESWSPFRPDLVLFVCPLCGSPVDVREEWW